MELEPLPQVFQIQYPPLAAVLAVVVQLYLQVVLVVAEFFQVLGELEALLPLHRFSPAEMGGPLITLAELARMFLETVLAVVAAVGAHRVAVAVLEMAALEHLAALEAKLLR